MSWVHDVLIKERGEDAPDCRLADLAADRVMFHTDGIHDRSEGHQLLDPVNIDSLREEDRHPEVN